MALANIPAVAPIIEPDVDYASTIEQEDDYQSRRKYWYQLRPGDYLIPLLALAPHHPLLNGGPIEPQTPSIPSSSSSSSHYPTSADGSTSAISSPTSHGPQHENTVAVPPSTSEPPPDRQLCEVWPISYRSADGWLKTCWCIQIDGEPSYQYRPPDFQALSTRYHLVYPPPPATMGTTTAMTSG